MPLVRITLNKGYESAFKLAISQSVHRSLVDVFGIPEDDLFQIIEEVAPDNMVFSSNYLEITHGEKLVLIQIVAKQGRTPEMKKALYRNITDRISATTGHPKEDVLITLLENQEIDWSFGNGIAQLAS